MNAPFPSVEWFRRLADHMNANRARQEQLGYVDCVAEFRVRDAAAAFAAASEAGFRADPDRPDGVRLSVPDDPRALAKALTEAGDAAADITRLHLAEPSLDDVFVALAAR